MWCDNGTVITTHILDVFCHDSRMTHLNTQEPAPAMAMPYALKYIMILLKVHVKMFSHGILALCCVRESETTQLGVVTGLGILQLTIDSIPSSKYRAGPATHVSQLSL
jgi:hypothetical protein